jgi:hypothetical protein
MWLGRACGWELVNSCCGEEPAVVGNHGFLHEEGFSMGVHGRPRAGPTLDSPPFKGGCTRWCEILVE